MDIDENDSGGAPEDRHHAVEVRVRDGSIGAQAHDDVRAELTIRLECLQDRLSIGPLTADGCIHVDAGIAV